MKRLMSVVLSMVVVLMMCGGAMAQECFNAQGSCLIPHIKGFRSATQGFYTRLHLSNITDGPVQCKIVYYDQHGNDVSGYGDVYTVSGDNVNWQLITTGNNSFEIPAHSTIMMEFTRGGVPNKIIGYGVVKWKSTDSQKQKALIGATMYSFGANSGSSMHAYGGYLALNHGDPF